MPYLSASAVVIHYEEVLYQVYRWLLMTTGCCCYCQFTLTLTTDNYLFNFYKINDDAIVDEQ